MRTGWKSCLQPRPEMIRGGNLMLPHFFKMNLKVFTVCCTVRLLYFHEALLLYASRITYVLDYSVFLELQNVLFHVLSSFT